MAEDVLLVTVDSLRADHVGCYGYGRETTPFVDELSAGGHTFTNAYAHACSTRPSFPSILTSTYSRMYGGYEQLTEERTLVSEPLAAAGYRTAGFHSNPYLSGRFGYDRAWDRFFESDEETSILARLRGYARDRLDDDGLVYRALKTLYDQAEKQGGLEVGSIYVSADDLTDHALEWAETAADGDRPRFMWIHYMDAHHPYVPPADHQRAFREEPIGDRRSIRLRRKMLEDPAAVTDGELSEILDLYDAEIRFVDHEVRRLVERVRALWDGATVLFTADHGEEFREHGRFSHHGTFHDEIVHVPFVVDDGTSPAEHDEMVGLLDTSPTVLDYAGAARPDSYLGHSVRALIEGGEWPRDRVRSFRYCRTRDWKYLRETDDGGTVESEILYDMVDDPGETASVAEENPDVLADLRASVDEVQEQIRATSRDVDAVEMDDDIQDRLRALGYRE